MGGSTQATLTPIAWAPFSQPQQALVQCPLDEIFFGGARGGGKTDAMLGKFSLKQKKYGAATVGVFFRKTREDLKEAIERSKEIYGPMGAIYTDQKKQWVFPSGARLKFEYLERDKDAENYQGHSYCVAVGTKIRMADGSLRPIQDVSVGDYVATLEGPRRVNMATEPYTDHCVEYRVFSPAGEYLGAQVHPATHPVLTSVSGPSQQSGDKPQSGARPRNAHAPWQSVLPHPYRRRAHSAESAWLEGEASDCKAFEDERLESGRLVLSSVPVVLSQPASSPSEPYSGASTLCRTVYKFVKQLRGKCRASDISQRWGLKRLSSHAQQLSDRIASIFCGRFPTHLKYAPFGFLQAEGFQSDCLPGFHSNDGQLLYRQAGGLSGAPLQGDVEAQPRDGSVCDGMDCTHEHSREQSSQYTHPYTGELRDLKVPVELGHAEVRYVGAALVMDLTVDRANHYITEVGLVNKNTDLFFEELTNWASPDPINKLRATLRSAAGVPCQFHATGNPGGPGHQWVKARYIDPCPTGYEIISEEWENPFTHEKVRQSRVFIPSKLSDNPTLMADPGYVARLYQSGSRELVRAWLYGDWDIVEGAFFDCWGPQHVIRPFEVPKDWLRFRSCDWGSAKPFSVGWWAVVPDWFETVCGAHLPRGAIIRYREWYGCERDPISNIVKPDTGLKLTAGKVGEGILERDAGEKIAYGVIDPAAFSQDGGPSIVENMKGINWRKADNKRVGTRGALGGWDMMRARMVGEDFGEPYGERPMMYVFSTCTDFLRTVPVLQHDENRPEDLDTASEDHAADEARYACMSRPYIPKENVVKFNPQIVIGGKSTMTINDLIGAVKRRGAFRD